MHSWTGVGALALAAAVLSVGWLNHTMIGTWLETSPHTMQGSIEWKNVATGESYKQLKCDGSKFHLASTLMEDCHDWLYCEDIRKMQVHEKIGEGAVKTVYRATWKGHDVALNKLKSVNFLPDFNHGKEMLKAYLHISHTTQFIGECEDIFITEYHPLGSLHNINHLPEKYNTALSIENRLKICYNYVKIISWLHDTVDGVRVMCDSSDLMKTLEQFLLREDFSLVVNDLDALPLLSNNLTIKCGQRELVGNFVAPEQRWPYGDEEFEDDRMPGYTEKTDIWKIPDVCNYILGNTEHSQRVKQKLFKINLACKLENPQDRPTSREVLDRYREVYYRYLCINWHPADCWDINGLL